MLIFLNLRKIQLNNALDFSELVMVNSNAILWPYLAKQELLVI